MTDNKFLPVLLIPFTPPCASLLCNPNGRIKRREKEGFHMRDTGMYIMLVLHKMCEWAVIPQFKSLISILSCLSACHAFEQTLT